MRFYRCLIFLLPGALWAQSIPHAALVYQRDLTRISQSVWGLSAPVATLGAQLQQESAYDPNAVSWAGAQGLSQMMPGTAAALARIYPELRPVNVFDPRWSLRAQSFLMRELWARYDDAIDCVERLAFSLASYSQGPGWTAKQRAISRVPRAWFGDTEYQMVGKSYPAFVETQQYVRRIILRLRPLYLDAGWATGLCG